MYCCTPWPHRHLEGGVEGAHGEKAVNTRHEARPCVRLNTAVEGRDVQKRSPFSSDMSRARLCALKETCKLPVEGTARNETLPLATALAHSSEMGCEQKVPRQIYVATGVTLVHRPRVPPLLLPVVNPYPQSPASCCEKERERERQSTRIKPCGPKGKLQLIKSLPLKTTLFGPSII